MCIYGGEETAPEHPHCNQVPECAHHHERDSPSCRLLAGSAPCSCNDDAVSCEHGDGYPTGDMHTHGGGEIVPEHPQCRHVPVSAQHPERVSPPSRLQVGGAPSSCDDDEETVSELDDDDPTG